MVPGELQFEGGCDCGGDIVLITYLETDEFGEKTGRVLVSHGVCSDCLKNFIYPNEPIGHFIAMGAKYGSSES